MSLVDIIKEYWILFAGVGVVLAPQIFNLTKTTISSLKSRVGTLGTLKGPKDSDMSGIIAKDLECLHWLANRGIDSKNEELVAEMENVNSRLFRIHRDMRKSINSSSE